MALREKQKDKLRLWIRVTMIFIAVLLLIFAVGIPIINNAIALGVEKDLKKLPLPADTKLVESTSMAAKLVGNGNGMQYFGAILIKSELSPEELETHYKAYRKGQFDCLVEPQMGADIRAVDRDLSFRHEGYGTGYYIVYTWGSAPDWLQDLLDTDLRGH